MTVDRIRAALAVVLIVAVLLGANLGLDPGRAGLAQDGTPEAVVEPIDVGHPAHVHAGGCGDDLGEVIEPLSDLTKTQGEEIGADAAIIASRSFTTVPMTLDELLAADHSLNVHLSAQEIDTYLACGPIGGVVDVNGALTIGLLDAGGDGSHSGVAYLAPADDGASTGILIFMTEDDATGSVGSIAAATPVAGVLTDAIEPRGSPARRDRGTVDALAADQNHAPRPVAARAQRPERVVQNRGRARQPCGLDRAPQQALVLRVVRAGERIDALRRKGQRRVQPRRTARLVGERPEAGHPALEPDGLVRDRRAADGGQERSVGRHEREISLGVAAIDGEDRGRGRALLRHPAIMSERGGSARRTADAPQPGPRQAAR